MKKIALKNNLSGTGNWQLASSYWLLATGFWLLVSILFPLETKAQDENYDAVYQKISKTYTLNADGSIDYNYVKQIKLQTYRSFQSLYGETFVVYNPAYQSLKVNEIYTMMADGKKVPSPSNAFNEVLPGFAANAPFYNNLREMVITHPGVERGAVIYLDYTIHTQKGFFPALMGNELLAEVEPVKELTLTIKVPSGTKVNYLLLQSGVKPQTTDVAGGTTFTWSFSNVAAISAEEYQPSGYDRYPRLLFSTKDRATIYQSFLKPTTLPAKSASSSQQAPVDYLKALDLQPVSGSDDLSTILKIQEKVVNDVRLWPIPMRYAGFVPRLPQETWNSNGGTLAEKALLMVEIMKAAGIEANPVLVIRKNQYDEKMGNLLDIEDILVKAKSKQSGDIYLSVASLNSQNLTFGMAEKLLISLDGGGKTTVVEPKENTGKIALKAELSVTDKLQLNGFVALNLDDNNDPWLAWKRDQGKSKTYFSGFASGDLKELKVITLDPVKGYAKYTVEKEKPFHKDSSFYFYFLPAASNGVDSWSMKALPKQRNAAFEIPTAIEEKYEIECALPKGLNLFTPEGKSEVSNKAGSFLFEVKYNGEKVKVIRSIKFEKRVYEASEYADFKALMDRWNMERNKQLIFTAE